MNTKSLPAEATETPGTRSFFRERPLQPLEMSSRLVHRSTRRDFLLFGAGAATLLGTGSLVPPATLGRLGFAPRNQAQPRREWLLNKALRLDDDIANIARRSLALGLLELFVRLLHDDDCRVHQLADRNRDASQRHYIRRDSHRMEWDERHEHGNWNRDYRDQRARYVPQE